MPEKSEPPLVLVVDDVAENLRVVGNVLRAELDIRIAVARNGAQAVESARRLQPDLILLDVMMPEMDGFTACKAIKTGEPQVDCPIIFLTAKVEEQDLLEGFEAGAVDYVTKPFISSELLTRVRSQLTIKRQQDKIREQVIEQRELLHVLCHDLTNPIATVRTILGETSNDLNLFEEFKDDAVKVLDNCLDAIQLVREMRAIDEGKREIEVEPVSLQNTLDISSNALRSQLQAKNITLVNRIPPDLEVLAEPVSLTTSVFNNLFSNAIKFSYPGSEIELDAEVSGDLVRIIVRDHGIGMSAAILGDLFDISKATSRPGTAMERGTGFGMPLVKRFMEAYEGQIEVASISEKEDANKHGTTMTLTFRKA